MKKAFSISLFAFLFLFSAAYAEDKMAKEDLSPLPPEGALTAQDIPPLTNLATPTNPASTAAPPSAGTAAGAPPDEHPAT